MLKLIQEIIYNVTGKHLHHGLFLFIQIVQHEF